jgi:DNA-binding MarR family transcriptional regulator
VPIDPGDIDTSGIDGVIGYRVRRAQLSIFSRFLARFAETGITPAEYAALILVADNPGRRPSVIAAALGMKRTNFVALAAGLEARGVLERRRPPGDRRLQALYLTAQGRTLARRLRGVQAGFEAELTDALGGPEARDLLLALLQKLG